MKIAHKLPGKGVTVNKAWLEVIQVKMNNLLEENNPNSEKIKNLIFYWKIGNSVIKFVY